MRKSLLLTTILLAILVLPAAAQKSFVKRARMQLVKYPSTMRAPQRADKSAVAMNNVVASYYTEASSSSGNQDNYYLVISDSENAVYNSTAGTIDATDATVVALDLYAPAGTGNVLPAGTYQVGEGSLNYDDSYSYSTYYDASGKSGAETAISGNVEVKLADDGTYTISFADEKGESYSFCGTLSFSDMNSGSAVYPQIPTDINTTFTGGMAFYHGNLMESNTGNIYINLYDCDFDPETGAMNSKGIDLAICAFNRLFGDPAQATIVPGTYTVARNFHSDTYFPGMEIDYSGMTIIMGTYVKRRKAMNGTDSDYDYGYITDGTITITEGETEGSFDFVVDCTTDRGHKVKGTAKNITFNIVDVSDDKETYVESNLDHDVTLDLNYIKTARAYYLGRQGNCNIFSVDIGSPSGKDGQEGDILRMEFQTATNQSSLPSGTYEVMADGHLYTNLYAPYQMTQGYFDNVGGRTGTRYEHFEKGRYCVVDTFAFVYSGRVGVEQLENGNYHFKLDLADGRGFLIQGEWTGPMQNLYDPANSINAVADEQKNYVVTFDGSHIIFSGNTSGVKASVYSAGGELLVKEADATSGIDASGMKQGVYVVKSSNGYTTKIVKK